MFNPFGDKALRAEIQELRGHIQEMASIVDWENVKRRGFEDGVAITGNEYTGYDEATRELARKYDGSGDWGNQIAQILIDARATAICGAGLKVSAPEGNVAEDEFIARFLDHNGLDEENLITFAKDGEIDGKILIKLVKELDDQGKPIVGVRLLPWSELEYKVIVEKDDYKKIKGVTYKLEDQVLTMSNPEEFIFFKLSGRTTKVNETRSKVAKVIMQMENLDRALQDLRKINKLFAHPTPWAQTQTMEEANDLVGLVETKKWKIGKFLAGTADFSFKGADLSGGDSLIKEIVTNVQLISGGTGIPPHFLGFPELMSNRATAENLMEMIVLATGPERKVHVGGWKEVVTKAMLLQNKLDNGSLNPEVVTVDIPYTSNEALEEVITVWLPLRESMYISEDTFLSKIPGVDPEKEKKKLEEEKGTEADQFESQKDAIRAEIAGQLEEARKAREEGLEQ